MMPEWIIRLMPIKENTILNDLGGYLRNVCRDIIGEKKRDLKESGNLAEHDILSRIIQTGEFTDEEVCDQMVTFLAAGVSSNIRRFFRNFLLLTVDHSTRQQQAP